MDALPDVRQLQSMVKKKGKAVDKMIDPPLVGGTEMRNSTVNQVPGGVTYTTYRDGKPSLQTLHEVQPPVSELREDINEIKQSISRAFFEDLFLALSMSDRRQMTAREVEERHGEKLIMLGPTLGRVDNDMLEPAIDFTFDELMKAGKIPPPPPDLEGVKLSVEFVNVLAQSQRQMGIGGTGDGAAGNGRRGQAVGAARARRRRLPDRDKMADRARRPRRREVHRVQCRRGRQRHLR